ncbi:MAG: dihydrodipicolinate synthase family protein [Saprospiraceae bacterium]
MSIIDGLVTATHTPMNKKGEIKYEVINDYFAFLKRNNVKGIFLNGSTSEGFHLTTHERKQSLEAWSNAVKDDDFKIFVFVGHLCTKDACDLSEHAGSFSNVYGISATAPFYQKPSSIELLIDVCAEIASYSPTKPFYYYHIPVLTNVNISICEFLNKAGGKISNLKGVKYTHNDLEEYFMASSISDGKYEMMAGIDEIALASRALGATGYIGSTYNFMALLYYEMFAAFDQGRLREARSLQKKAIEIVRLIAPYGFISAAKFIMKELGIDSGYVRLPSKQISESEKKELMVKLKNSGFENFQSQ